jgi:hypothetical protein
MHGWQQWLVYLAVLAVLALGMTLGRRLWRRQREQSGLSEWARTASTLRRRDRWRLAWSTSTGRAVSDPQLAASAAQRAMATQEMLVRVIPRMKWIWIAIGLYWLVVGGLRLFEQRWLWGSINLGLAAAFGFMPQLVAWDARRAGRSAEVNRRLAEGR